MPVELCGLALVFVRRGAVEAAAALAPEHLARLLAVLKARDAVNRFVRLFCEVERRPAGVVPGSVYAASGTALAELAGRAAEGIDLVARPELASAKQALIWMADRRGTVAYAWRPRRVQGAWFVVFDNPPVLQPRSRFSF